MHVLYCIGDNLEAQKLKDFLIGNGETVTEIKDKLTVAHVIRHHPDLLISYNYRFIIGRDVLERMNRRAINLHIAYLPWNRGADPNFWSHVEGTPAGVTIHRIDSGVDTGDILAQRRVDFSDDDTLHSSYVKLHENIRELFKEIFPLIKTNKLSSQPQVGEGTTHRMKDRERFVYLTQEHGFDTPIADLAKIRLDHSIIHRCFDC